MSVLDEGIASIRRTFAAHIPLYLFSAVSCAAIFAALSSYNIAPMYDQAQLFLIAFSIFLVVAGILAIMRELWILVAEGLPPNPLRLLADRFRARLFSGDRVGNVVHSCLALFPLFYAFIGFKNALTRIHQFNWDVTLSNLDRSIGFGHQPWQLMQAILGYPAITTILAYAYYVWFVALFWSFSSQAFSPRVTALRMQFLLSLALTFILGGCILALIFSSAGPCYFAHLNLGFDPYAEQMAYLRNVSPGPLISVFVQDALWASFASGALQQGVSAMPSLHVTIAVLIALLGWRKGGAAAAVLPGFAILITLGSVHLAWHYASDAIAGIGLAVVFWLASGSFVRRWNKFIGTASSRKLADIVISPAE